MVALRCAWCVWLWQGQACRMKCVGEKEKEKEKETTKTTGQGEAAVRTGMIRYRSPSHAPRHPARSEGGGCPDHRILVVSNILVVKPTG